MQSIFYTNSMSGASRNNMFWKQTKPLNRFFRHVILLALARRSKWYMYLNIIP